MFSIRFDSLKIFLKRINPLEEVEEEMVTVSRDQRLSKHVSPVKI